MTAVEKAYWSGLAAVSALTLFASPLRAQLYAPAVREATELRTMYSRTWENADGTRTAEIATRPLHYQAADGTLQPVSTTLTATSRVGFAVANETNPLRTYLPANAAGWVRVETGRSAVSFRPVGAAAGAIAVSDSRATYVVADNTSIAYEVEPGRVKESIVLTAPVAKPVFDFEFATEGYTPTLNPDGSVLLKERVGDNTLTVEAPWMRDAAGSVSYAIAVRVLQTAEGFTYSLAPDAEWLARAIYPVVIDPTFSWASVGSNWSAVVREAYPSMKFVPGMDYYASSAGNYPVVGALASANAYRVVLHYESALPLDSDINTAELTFTVDHSLDHGSETTLQAYGLPKYLDKDATDGTAPTWTNVVTNGGTAGPSSSSAVVVEDYGPGEAFALDVFDMVRDWDEKRDDNIAVPQNVVLRDTSDTGTVSGMRFACSTMITLTVTYSEGWYTLQGSRRRQGRSQYAISTAPTEQWDTTLDSGPSQPGDIAIPPGIVAVPDFQYRYSGRPAIYAAVSSDTAESRVYRIRDNGTSVTKTSILLQGVTLTGTPLVLPGPTSSADTVYLVGQASGGVAHIYKYTVQLSGGQVVWTQAAHYSFDGQIPSSPVYYPRTTTYTLRKTGGALEQATSSGAIIVSAAIASKGYLLAFSPATLRPVWGRVVESSGALEWLTCAHGFSEPGGLCRLGTFATENVTASESSPCLVAHSVYVQDTSCYLNVRSAMTGAWEAPGEIEPTLSGVLGSVSSHAGRVYYGDTGGYIVGAETAPLAALWARPTTAANPPGGGPFDLYSIFTTGAVSAENASVLYVNDRSQLLAARTDYDPNQPLEPMLWGLELNPEQTPARCSPLVAGAPGSGTSVAFIGTDDARVHLVNPSSGLRISDIPSGGASLTGGIVRSGMAAYRGRLYVLTSGRQTDLTPIGWAHLHCYY